MAMSRDTEAQARDLNVAYFNAASLVRTDAPGTIWLEIADKRICEVFNRHRETFQMRGAPGGLITTGEPLNERLYRHKIKGLKSSGRQTSLGSTTG